MTLKIQKSVAGECVVFTLSGRIEMEHLAELQRLFEIETQDLAVVLDMKEVKLVDRDALSSLARWELDGVKLENCPAYIREWIVQERAGRNRSQRGNQSMTDAIHRIGSFQGSEGKISVRAWQNPAARHLVVIAHGYGEHIGRYEHVAQRLVATGSSVWGPDHLGHGRSDGERALVRDFEHVVDDLDHVVAMARESHHELPVVLIGHSMGGMIAARYAQCHGGALAGLILSSPALGRLEAVEQLLALPQIADVPIDPAVLSRDSAVGEAYASDPLVYHGPFKRQTLESMRTTLVAIDTGPGFGELPTLWLHGSDDKLVPIESARTGLAKLRGAVFTERSYESARHELFNETNQAEVLGEVSNFIDRVTR